MVAFVACLSCRVDPSSVAATEPVRPVPVPDGGVGVRGDDDLKVELGQPSRSGAEGADGVDVAAPHAGPARTAVLDDDLRLDDVAGLAEVVDLGAGRDPPEVGVCDGTDVAE